ncbi:MAG: signal peptidase II [Bdellovibrionaceae bacterium]|nr:signal peptidase II [Pseudobdellovibrionaceae bacterium]
MKKWYLFFLMILVVVSIDQLAKLYTLENFFLGQSRVLIPSLLHWTYVVNRGGAFGFLANTQFDDIYYLFIIISIVAITIAVYFVHSLLFNGNTLLVVSIGIICGGILGNLIDRIRFGYVVDFIDFHVEQKWSFPAFNLADLGIVVGGIFLLVNWLKKGDLGRTGDEGKKGTSQEI